MALSHTCPIFHFPAIWNPVISYLFSASILYMHNVKDVLSHVHWLRNLCQYLTLFESISSGAFSISLPFQTLLILNLPYLEV